MSIDYFEATVSPTIPAKCLTPVESWLLRRVFITEEKDDRLGFDGCWSLEELFQDTFSIDEELGKALAASRQVCPDLCAAVEREIAKNGEISLSSVDYESIFQSIIRRHPDFLQHISIERRNCTKWRDHDDTFTLITANAIGSIHIERVYENCDLKDIQIVHRTGPWMPESPYIFVTEDKDEEDDNVIHFSHWAAALRRKDDPDDPCR